MIELKVKDIPGRAKYSFWIELHSNMTSRSTIAFDLFDYRIDGVVYTTSDPKFEKAFEQIMIWGRLSI